MLNKFSNKQKAKMSKNVKWITVHDNFTREETLAWLCKNGYELEFRSTINIDFVNGAKRALSIDKSVDYLLGVPIKTTFSTFPRLYVELYLENNKHTDFRPLISGEKPKTV